MTEPRKNGRQCRRSSDECKREGVQLLAPTSASAAEISAHLGVSDSTLWRWHKQVTASSTAAERPTTYEALDQDVGWLRVENDVLNKASSYFDSRRPTGIR